MALDASPKNLWSEVRRSIDYRDKFLGQAYEEALRRFYGPAYRAGQSSVVDFENHAYSWISIFLPILASGNPRVRAKTPRMGPAAAFSKAVELAVNRNFELTDAKRTIEQLATDWAFRYCAAITTPTPQAGLREREDPNFRPTTKRLPLDEYVHDPVARQHAECRFQGHRLTRDREDIELEAEQSPGAGWNLSAIDALHNARDKEAHRARLDTDVDRNEVSFWEIWVPEIKLDEATDAEGGSFEPLTEDGFNGTIFTIGEGLDEFVRAPRPFFGPRDGAYTFNGYLYVPNESVPLSPLVATAAQAEIYNAVMESAIESIKGYKRGVAVGSDSGNLDEIIADFRDLGIFKVEAIEKLADMMKEVEVLGLTPQHMAQLEMLRTLLERQSGVSEAIQGTTSGATATEASIASMSVGKRMGYMTEKFINGVVKPIAKKEAWYLSMDPRSRTELGELAEGLFFDPNTGQPIEMPILVGGTEHLDLLESHDIEIQPISMRYTTEMLEAERAASWEAFLLSTAPLIPQIPYIDWGMVYSRKAEQLGDPSLARTIDIQKAMLMGQIQMMMTLGQPLPVGAQQSTAQPRLGADIGKPKPPTLKSSESPAGFTGNARASAATSAQQNKGPRMAGASSSAR
jgi:hypothetical protein